MKRLSDTQKAAIQEYRAAGLGYKSIAEKLSLSRDTVRSYCIRNGIGGNAETAENEDHPLCSVTDNTSEIKSGNTVFVISTGYSEGATETLENKLKALILNAAARESRSYHFVQN